MGYLTTLSLKFFIIKWDVTAPRSQDGSGGYNGTMPKNNLTVFGM